MNENLKFLVQILGLTSVLLIASLVPVFHFGNAELVRGVLFGYFVSLANILLAFFSIKWAFDKSNKTFFSVVLGGMGVRFVLLLSALFFVRSLDQVHLLAFIVSVIGFYLTLQFFEIKYIQNHLATKRAIT